MKYDLEKNVDENNKKLTNDIDNINISLDVIKQH